MIGAGVKRVVRSRHSVRVECSRLSAPLPTLRGGCRALIMEHGESKQTRLERPLPVTESARQA
jgi:hypothetical protein